MFLNILSKDSSGSQNDHNNFFYQKFQHLLGRETGQIRDNSEGSMLSARPSSTVGDDTFITPVSSVGDLLNMSPETSIDLSDHHDMTGDLLTGTEFDSICDVTMKEVPMYDEMFIDATSLDYLVKCAESNPNRTQRDRGKESLFVKFDPLYARKKIENLDSACSVSVSESLEGDVGYETGSAASVFMDQMAVPKHSFSGGLVGLCGKDKPTQVVTPVVNSDMPKCNVSQVRSTPALVRSVSAILTPTHVATERLINISGNTSTVEESHSLAYSSFTSHQVDRVQSVKCILQKQMQEIMQLRQENTEFKYLLRDLEHKHSRETEDMDLKIRKLTEERNNLMEKENKLIQQVHDKIISNKQMSIVMEEYEKTISSLISEQQRDRIASQELHEQLLSERDQALNHLSSMESSFNDLLAKYEKCKSVILEVKEREKIFEQKISEYDAGMKKYEILYNNLKQITSDELNNANETLENIKKSHNVEITKLNATIRKHDITIASLQESLVQKTRDNDELTRICDQLINEVR